MEDKLKVLEEIGLSKNEAIVYITLLDLGSATATKIADKSKLHRTTVYDVLDRLVEKGMASHILKKETKYFEAAEPESLLGILKQREENLLKVLPQLKLSNKMSESKAKATIFEGLAGVKTTMRQNLETLKDGDTFYVFGVPKNVTDLVGRPFLDWFHKKRIEKKVTMWHIYNEDAGERMKYMNSLPYTKARYFPPEYSNPVVTRIHGNKVVFVVWDENPMAVEIDDKRMADAYRKYFKLLWGLAKK